MKNNLIGMVVMALVCITIIGALLVPTINEVTTTEEVFTNDGVFEYGIFSPTDEYSLEFDGTDGSITVNGELVTPISGVTKSGFSVLMTDTVLFRYLYQNSAYYMQIIGEQSDDTILVSGGDPITATISNGELVATYYKDSTTYTATFDFTEMYGIVSESSDAVLKASSSEVYILGDSEIYASGTTQVTAWHNFFHFEGTYNDGLTISSTVFPDATYDNIEWNIESVDGYVDLYKLTSIEFDITEDDTTVHATYSYFAVPNEVTAELSHHMSAAEITLISIFPLLLIMMVLCTFAYVAVRVRD